MTKPPTFTKLIGCACAALLMGVLAACSNSSGANGNTGSSDAATIHEKLPPSLRPENEAAFEQLASSLRLTNLQMLRLAPLVGAMQRSHHIAQTASSADARARLDGLQEAQGRSALRGLLSPSQTEQVIRFAEATP